LEATLSEGADGATGLADTVGIGTLDSNDDDVASLCGNSGGSETVVIETDIDGVWWRGRESLGKGRGEGEEGGDDGSSGELHVDSLRCLILITKMIVVIAIPGWVEGKE